MSLLISLCIGLVRILGLSVGLRIWWDTEGVQAYAQRIVPKYRLIGTINRALLNSWGMPLVIIGIQVGVFLRWDMIAMVATGILWSSISLIARTNRIFIEQKSLKS